MTKPSIPKGTRDFMPAEVAKRNYIFDQIKKVFTTFGYVPIETPTMELLATLTGKYGEEGDKLLFKVLNNGDFLKDANKEALDNLQSQKLVSSISKRGLRYDLTVPFARFVVMHQNEISFPFKRYQIQPVWRADSPQRGRFQEFYQCDVDVVGSDSLMYEAELMQIYHDVFRSLGLKVNILINNRKILFGVAEAAGIADHFMEMTIAIDKMDKIGRDGVIAEMLSKGISNASAHLVLELMSKKTLDELKEAFANSETGQKGIAEVENVMALTGESVPNLVFSINLARGLNYYTGCIFEVVLDAAVYPDLKMGSLGGGGRYDDLTGTFGMKDMSGVGVSFGAERIFIVMEELGLFPENTAKDIEVLFIALDEESHLTGFKWLYQLRQVGVACDMYPKATKMNKQMKYANDRKVPYVAIIGEEEKKQNSVMLKNMETGVQQVMPFTSLLNTAVSGWV
ncbi:MAG: histidine--tRNA ligase [Saprospiraceae bacterium]|nr:histidine--tRNA ligase [Saprospiraceae bacterium]MBK6565101.1 histidine--tRNA ligase [Saprospiraceae bacterium]MBK6785540.1 histidine--tRNA ligase [Saprospiraceae bacterium]MBK8545855.1 histidine--tRNA ligase [Saprospiraceae bacterium]MBK8853847.1 histidine--tRNA ligase [Saprospiraceae bacterium]